ncbi:unnamed protein product, partial [marine sediment metagenome]
FVEKSSDNCIIRIEFCCFVLKRIIYKIEERFLDSILNDPKENPLLIYE